MDKRSISILIIIVVVVGGAIYGLSKVKTEEPEDPLFNEVEMNIVTLEDNVVNSITGSLDTLSPEKPVLGGSWYVTRFGLIDNNRLYVEYEDGHIVRRMLLERNDDDWSVLGFFEPGKDMWQLTQGEDPYMDADLSIYEHSEDGSDWELVK